MVDQLTYPWLLIKPIYKVSETNRIIREHQWKGMTKLAQNSIEFYETKYANGGDDLSGFKLKPQIFCDQVFKNRSEFTDEEMVHEVNLMIVAVSSY